MRADVSEEAVEKGCKAETREKMVSEKPGMMQSTLI